MRITDQIQCNLTELTQCEIKNPVMGLMTLRSATLMLDYAYAEIYFTVLGAGPGVVGATLNEKVDYLHPLLLKRLHIHTVPILYLHFDDSVERGIEMSRLIDKASITHAKGD